MSKYVIDLCADCKVVEQIRETDGNVFVTLTRVDNLEVLNADYVNEHFGILQDDAYNAGFEKGKKEAYQKGFEDGKWKSEDGCTGCKYEGKTGEHLPCDYCTNNFKNQWTAKQTDDKSIDIIRNGIHNWVTELNVKLDDIASILEEMRHD